jgi:Protein of unknown function (DUF3348)
MTRAPARTPFHSARLIRILADLALLTPGAGGNAFAEKLGQWVDFTAAIALSGALNDASPAAPAGTMRRSGSATLDDALARVRTHWVNAITLGAASQARIRWPEPPLDPGADNASTFGPYRRYYLAYQREMETSIQGLRAQARDALSQASPALHKLASLDAVMEGVLHEREGKLLATVPGLLAQRFAQLRQAHQLTLADTGQPDNIDTWIKPGAWLARFGQELQTVLLAELDLRLQPCVGLIEAFNTQHTTHP